MNSLHKLRTFSKRLELISKRIFFEDINNYTESKTIDLKERITLIIAIGTNKGLCGAYNVNLGREVKDCSKILEKKNKDYRILIVGKKLDIILKKLVDPSRIIFINQEPSDPNSYKIQNNIIDLIYENKKIDHIVSIGTYFKNVFKQIILSAEILPFPNLTNDLTKVLDLTPLMEPCLTNIRKKIIKDHIRLSIILLLTESFTCEHACRMNTMENSSNNAREMINQININYNKKRQALITKELIEITSSSI